MSKKVNYKGKGEHSVTELELIISQQKEELHLVKSNQKDMIIKTLGEDLADSEFEVEQLHVQLQQSKTDIETLKHYADCGDTTHEKLRETKTENEKLKDQLLDGQVLLGDMELAIESLHNTHDEMCDEIDDLKIEANKVAPLKGLLRCANPMWSETSPRWKEWWDKKNILTNIIEE